MIQAQEATGNILGYDRFELATYETNMKIKHQPSDITVDKPAHKLQIEWNDGYSSTFPLDQLREACPCAVCRGGHEFMGREHDPLLIEIKPARSYQITGAEIAGNYALRLSWDDGHDSGIYSWDYLRRLDTNIPQEEIND